MTTTFDWLTPTNPNATLVEAGRVFVIRCVPDVFTGEMFNVGVCAMEAATGRRKARVITEPGRLSCYYGEGASNVVALAQAALEAATTGAPPPSEQIIFDTPTPYYNATLDDLVNSTFSMQVTAAISHRPKEAEAAQITDDIAREKAIDAIKQARGLEADFIANTPMVIDAVAWRCNKSLHLEVEPTAELLAIRIGQWADTHA
jgi:hypothetical protein